ncbi:MAG TPA: HEAT repeat domain-containing protein, partial [Thermodesulfovibrionales bacterium]|nr:HEAT repeat domain-containing protein [Thermodesulfovibrionales bacterium]
LRRLSSFSDSVTDAGQKAVLGAAVNGMGSSKIIKVFFGNVSDTDVLTSYLSLLDDACTSNMIEVLGELEDRKMRRFLCNSLVGRATRNISAFEAGLEDARWFLVRNLVMILGMTKDIRAVSLMEKVRRHPEVRVRREVVRALKTMHSTESRGLLLPFLEDSDPTVRIDAVTSLRRYGGNDLFLLLKGIIEREDFREKSYSEKRELLGAFGEVGKEQAFPILSGLFRKKGLFEREDAVELRACAAYGLGYVRTADAISLLEKEVNSKKSILRDACINALKETPGK